MPKMKPDILLVLLGSTGATAKAVFAHFMVTIPPSHGLQLEYNSSCASGQQFPFMDLKRLGIRFAIAQDACIDAFALNIAAGDLLLPVV